MVFEVLGKTEKYVKLLKDGEGVEFLGKYIFNTFFSMFMNSKCLMYVLIASRNLVEYEIQTEKLKIRSAQNISIASLTFVFRRRMEYHVTNTFLQVTFLVIRDKVVY